METDLPKLMSMLEFCLSQTVYEKLCTLPEYGQRHRDNDTLWVLATLEFVATGQGAHSVHIDAININRLRPENGNYGAFLSHGWKGEGGGCCPKGMLNRHLMRF